MAAGREAKVIGLQRVQVSGHAAKGDGHAVEIEFMVVVGGQVGNQELVDAAFAEQSVVQLRAVPQANRQCLGNLVAVLAAAENSSRSKGIAA